MVLTAPPNEYQIIFYDQNQIVDIEIQSCSLRGFQNIHLGGSMMKS